MASQYSQYAAVQPLQPARDTHPFRQEDAWAVHNSMADRRRAPAQLPPCIDQDRREKPSMDSPYHKPSCSLPPINDLFASQQLITPTSASKSDSTSTIAVHIQSSTPPAVAQPLTPAGRPYFGRSASEYRLSQPYRSPGLQHYQLPTGQQSPKSTRPSDGRLSISYQPHRKADIASLLNNPEEDDRRSWPLAESASALRSETVSPSTMNPRSHQPRCDSPFEAANARRGPIPMPQQEFAPATYVYQSTAYEGVQNIPGLGPHHVYAGGYCVPTHVLGEAVNPYWGLTKGKVPRKRLSVACSTCRKKKIRCEPSLGGCLQCKKAQRPCCVEAVKRRRTRVSASSDADMSDDKDATMGR